jgi:hypothetical protein
MALTDIAARRPHPLSRLLAWITLLGLAMPVAAVLAAQSPVSCERHRGTFADTFASTFDVNRTDCRVASWKGSPTIHFWEVSPHVGIEWPAGGAS